MASVYKRGRDRGRQGAYWYVSFDDEKGVRRSRRAFTDKRASKEYAQSLEQEAKQKKVGLLNAADQKRAFAAELTIEEHLLAFEKSISKNTDKHVSLTLARIRLLIRKAKFNSLSDIDVDSVVSVLDDMLKSEEISRKTFNHYVSSIKQFGDWLVPNRLSSNPLAGIKRLNADVDVKRPRRALTADEFSRLIDSARKSNKSIQCYDGETRARIYLLSYFTGLRRKEIASLTPASFNLKASPAILTIEAANSKHRKKDVLPVHPDLAVLLKLWLRGTKRTEPLFPKLATRRTSVMVKKDLERAGIDYLTDEGYADFHAAGRHTHITELLRNGVSLPEARKLARHSDVRMTMKYTHVGLMEQAKALDNLPGPQNIEKSKVHEQVDDWQRPASGLKHAKRHPVSTTDNEVTTQEDVSKGDIKHENKSSDNITPPLSLTDTQADKDSESGSIPAASTFDIRCQMMIFDENPC